MSIYQKVPNNQTCYQCTESSSNLVSACDNKDCEAKFHRECLFEYVEKNNMICPKCSQEIISNRVERLDTVNFCGNIFLILGFVFMYTIGFLTPGLAIFSTSIINSNMLIKPSTEIVVSFAFSVALSGLIGGLYLATFIFFHISKRHAEFGIEFTERFGECCGNWFLYAMFLVLISIHIAISFCHLFGFFILKFIFDSGYHYDQLSFCTGLIFVIICTIIFLIIRFFVNCCKGMYKENLKEEIVYGV